MELRYRPPISLNSRIDQCTSNNQSKIQCNWHIQHEHGLALHVCYNSQFLSIQYCKMDGIALQIGVLDQQVHPPLKKKKSKKLVFKYTKQRMKLYL